MAEHYTEALVLGRDIRNDQDSIFILYTKNLGKVRAVAKSARKITSKLSGHLKPGRLVDVRLVDKGSYQLLDALSRGRRCRNREALRLIRFLENMTPHNQPDLHVWHVVKEILARCQIEPAVYRELLGIMGFIPSTPSQVFACAKCKKKNLEVKYFYIPDMVFLCSNCVTDARIDKDDSVPIA